MSSSPPSIGSGDVVREFPNTPTGYNEASNFELSSSSIATSNGSLTNQPKTPLAKMNE